MKRIALWACLAIFLVLAVFSGVIVFSGSEEAAAAVVVFAMAAIVVAINADATIITAFAAACIATLVFALVTDVVLTIPVNAVVTICVVVIVAGVAMIVAVIFDSAMFSVLKLPVWRALPVHVMEGMAIFGSLYFYSSVGWWSTGIGAAGIALILAFWQGCEWYDRRHRQTPIADTLHGDT